LLLNDQDEKIGHRNLPDMDLNNIQLKEGVTDARDELSNKT